MRNGGNLFPGRHFAVSKEREQPLLISGIGAVESIDEQVSLFAAKYVATNFLAEHFRVAVHVEPVVLHLESQAHLFGKTVKRAGIFGRSPGGQCPSLCGAGQQYGGLEPYHLHVFAFRHVAATLEIYIVLLSLANFECRVCEEFEYLLFAFATGFDEMAESND